MGFLKAASLAAVLAALLALRCSEPPQRAGCESACQQLEGCRLLPSPLGTGPDRERNCVERCRLADADVASKILGCHDDANQAAGDAYAWCRPDDSCRVLSECLANEYPGVSPSGIGVVEVRIGVDPAARAHAAGTCTLDEPITNFDPDACQDIGVNDIALFPIPAATGVERAELQKACADAVAASFPAVQTRAGVYQAKLKLIGPGPAPEARDAGSDAAAADAGSMPAASAGPLCRVLYATPVGVAAGVTTRVNVTIPGDWARSAALLPCERNCFDSSDDDGDGLVDCADPACLPECIKCRLTTAEDGRLLPDCSDPACPCFVPPRDAGVGPTPNALRDARSPLDDAPGLAPDLAPDAQAPEPPTGDAGDAGQSTPNGSN